MKKVCIHCGVVLNQPGAPHTTDFEGRCLHCAESRDFPEGITNLGAAVVFVLAFLFFAVHFAALFTEI